MKTVKQILEHHNVYNDIRYGEKLKAVSDIGLLEENKLPILKRALQKEASQLTNAEKKVLNELVESLTEANHLSKFDKRRPMGFPKGDKDVPVVLILKRKAIRIYPDNQKVALYYSDMLDKYFSVPFGPGTEHLGIHMSEAKKEEDDLDPKYKEEYSKIEKEREQNRKLRRVASSYASRGLKKGDWEIAKDENLHKAHLENIASERGSTAYKAGRRHRAKILRGIALTRELISGRKRAGKGTPIEKPPPPSISKPETSIKKTVTRVKRTSGLKPPPALAGLRTRNPKQTAKRASEILDKNPSQVFSKGAQAAGAAKVSKQKGPIVK